MIRLKVMNAFIYKQLPNYLFPADIYALRIINRSCYGQIALNVVYNTANKIILNRLGNNPEYFEAEWYHDGYFIVGCIFLLECLTGTIFDFVNYNKIYDFVKSLKSYNFEFFTLQDFLVNMFHSDVSFLKIVFFEEQVYVADWNSIIEKKTTIKTFANEHGYFCAKSCIANAVKLKRRFKSYNYYIEIARFKYCFDCEIGNNCLDQHFNHDNDDNHLFNKIHNRNPWPFQTEDDLMIDDDELDEDDYLFSRLKKRIKRIKKKNKFIKKKQQ